MSEVTITGPIIHQDMWATVERELHLQAPELGVILVSLVREKTPVLTGALQSSITAIANPPGDRANLLEVFPADDEQLITWGRIYAPYQEGPPLGLSTYTNEPRQMFQLTADTDGLAATEIWAQAAVDGGLALAALGNGVRFGGGTIGFA